MARNRTVRAALDPQPAGQAEAKLHHRLRQQWQPQVRAHRRWLEVGGDAARVLAEVEERDARDMGRADAPLRPAPDAFQIDTSDLSIEAAIAAAIAAVVTALPQA